MWCCGPVFRQTSARTNAQTHETQTQNKSPDTPSQLTRCILGNAKPQQQHNDAEDVRHVAAQAEYIHRHGSGWSPVLARRQSTLALNGMEDGVDLNNFRVSLLWSQPDGLHGMGVGWLCIGVGSVRRQSNSEGPYLTTNHMPYYWDPFQLLPGLSVPPTQPHAPQLH